MRQISPDLTGRSATKGSVLFVSTSFYPLNSPGSHRIANTARFLPEYGWDPSILCLDWRRWGEIADATLCGWDYCPVARAPNPKHRRWSLRWGLAGLTRKIEERFLPGTAPSCTYRSLVREGRGIIEISRPDVIVGTYPPFVNLSVARRLAQLTGKPWVADLRDIPDEFGRYEAPEVKRAVSVETRLCATAAAITTVSEPLANQLRTRHEVPVSVVLNGFNEDDFTAPAPSRDDGKFEIVYAGKLDEYRTAGAILDPLDALITQGVIEPSDLQVSFFGNVYGAFHENLAGHPCASSVVHHGFLPHAECIRRQRTADVLLFLSHNTGIGIFTSKIFEYLAARRPILSTPGDHGVTDALLAETKSGIVARSGDEVQSALAELYSQWKAAGRTLYGGHDDVIKAYSRRRQTRLFADTLSGLFE